MFLCQLNINRYLIFCVSLLFFLRLSLRHLRGSCHVPPPEGAGLFDKEPNGMPRIHGHPRPKRTGPCEGRGDIVRAQLAPAPCLVADARGPPWCQQARLQAKEPHKLASGRMSRGTNPDSALHSDMPLRLVALGKRVKLGVIRCVERELAVCSNLICLHLLLCRVVVRVSDNHCACGVFFNNR